MGGAPRRRAARTSDHARHCRTGDQDSPGRGDSVQPARATGARQHGRLLVHAAGPRRRHDSIQLAETANRFIATARKRPEIGRIYTTFSASTPGYQLEVDRDKARKLDVPVNAVFNALQSFVGGFQVNDFTRFGRNYKVMIQADPTFRERIEYVADAVRAGTARAA